MLEPRYRSAFGHDVDAPASTVAALSALLGEELGPAPLVLDVGAALPGLVGTVVCEDATVAAVSGRLPADVGPGYHRLVVPGRPDRRLIVCPATFAVPERAWGFSVQLYAARTAHSWGIGDFSDLARLAARAAGLGAGALLVSPLHAAHPGPHQQPSPYSPTSRLFLNLSHLDVAAVPGAEAVDLEDLAVAGRALNATRLLDRDRVWALKLEGLERIWAATAGAGAGLGAVMAERGDELARFATWCAMAEVHPGPFWELPAELAHPEAPGVAAFAAAHAERVAFWAWCQAAAEIQLDAACRAGLDVVVDLAVGVDPGGYDAWAWQELFCAGWEVGCPPDPRNADGQRWGLPPWHPGRLTAAGYQPFIDTVRAALRHAGALRIDHVMALWRLFWLPRAGAGHDGCYVRYPSADLLGILRLEAQRAGGWVVGEDMGTVADEVRDEMAARRMLGYRVAVRSAPDSWPEGVMGAWATHDQPTVAGALTGADTAALRRLGRSTDWDKAEALSDTVAALAGADRSRPGPGDVADAVEAVYAQVGASPARLVLASLDDLAGVAERPNIPGTVDEWPNWRIGLPVAADEVISSPLARRVAARLAPGRPGPASRSERCPWHRRRGDMGCGTGAACAPG